MTTVQDQLEKRDGATKIAVDNLVQWVLEKYAGTLPADYIDFLYGNNGTIGRGPDIYIILDKAEEVAATTEGYGVDDFAPGLVIIGSDGLGNLIGVDCRTAATDEKRYLRTDALAMSWEDQEASRTAYAPTLLKLLQVIAD